MEHNPNDSMCKCEKCMTKSECTPDSADCGNELCKVCMKKFWNGSAFEGKI